jgi:hypothetical protein
MAKAEPRVPRRRGRPKADNTALIDDVLVEWLRSGGADGRNLDQAVRAVAEHAREEGHTRKARRERIRDALADMWTEEMMQRAIDAVEQRGIAVPAWARDKLAEAQRRNREWEARLAARHGRQIKVIEGQLRVLDDRYDEKVAEAERVRRLVEFSDFFRLDDMPALMVADLLAACEDLVESARATRFRVLAAAYDPAQRRKK